MSNIVGYFVLICQNIINNGDFKLLLPFFIFVIFIEIPHYLIIFLFVIRTSFIHLYKRKTNIHYYPTVSIVVTCYNEGKSVEKSIFSLIEQIYFGKIEIFIVVDGASQNQETLLAAQDIVNKHCHNTKRPITIIPKYIRGGRVSSINTALHFVKGEIVMALDGDTSCDNQAIMSIIEEFQDPKVIASSGVIRVRNAKINLVTKLQALEYLMGIQMAKIGLSALNSVNNISGAFGCFRNSVLQKIGGWRTGSAEDLDITTRLQSLFKHYPTLKIIHTSNAIAHTDVPTSWIGLLKQRLRWDGDLYYIWIRRYRRRLVPSYMGKTSFFVAWGGLLFNMVLPVVILCYLPYIMINFSHGFVFSIFAISYLYYFTITIIGYTITVILISERKLYDLSFIIYLPLIPIYQFIMRLWTGVAIIYEVILKSHRYSSMAPWWVLRNKQ